MNDQIGRRAFLGLSGGAALAGVFGSWAPEVAAAASARARFQVPASRVLVVVDLQGGNDALNTLVPQAGRYRDLRPTVAIPEAELLTFSGLPLGVHPALGGMRSLWQQDQMLAVYGTGIENQGRSHFAAQDAWRTARPYERVESGWLGRWLEASFDSERHTPLRAVAIGQSSLALQSRTRQPVAVQSLGNLKLSSPRVANAVLAMSDPRQSGPAGRAQAVMPDSVWASISLQSALGAIEPEEGAEPAAEIGLFQGVQEIIQADLGTEVIYLTIDGFDTHSLQPQRHGPLLELIGNGLGQLYSALEASGHAEQTLALVVSEFGRRVEENGSLGTDHGRGGLSLVVGPPARGSEVVGGPDLDDLVDGDLQTTTDARVLYDNALRWLGADDEGIRHAIGGRWNTMNLVGP